MIWKGYFRSTVLIVCLVLEIDWIVSFCNGFSVRSTLPFSTLRSKSSCLYSSSVGGVEEEEYDVVVVGAGLGGLCCAALCETAYGLKTLCVESHDTAGGVAHAFTRKNKNGESFEFDAGPSLLSGMSLDKGSTNPLRQVLDAVNASDEVEWCQYDGWMVHDLADDTSFKLTTGDSGAFEQAIEQKAGKQARIEFEQFRDVMLSGLTKESAYIPPFALRGDGPINTFLTIQDYIFKILSIGLKGPLLTGPFTLTMDKYNVSTPHTYIHTNISVYIIF